MGWSFNATGMGLMITALAFLCLGGIQYNNLISSGFTAPQPATTCLSINCPAYGQTNAAPIIACSTPTQCQLSAPSFLNPNSPFTFLFSGDLPGFVNSFTGTSSGSDSLNALSTCIAFFGSQNSITRLNCHAASWAIPGPPKGHLPIVGCAYTNPGTTLSVGYNVSAITAPITGKSGNVNQTNWQISGCLPAANGVSATNQSAVIDMYACLTTNTASGCVSSAGDNGTIIVDKYNPGLLDLFTTNGGVFSEPQGVNFFAFVGFILGVVMLIMAFGMGGQFNSTVFGTGVGAGGSTNPQGTKLAQVLGIGLIVWIPLYSEFSGWISSIAGFGLDVFVNTLLLGLFFVGLWTQITQSGATAS